MNVSKSNNPKKRSREEIQKIRARIFAMGHTSRSFAQAHGVSTALVSRLITGSRPGVRGKSGEIREIIFNSKTK